MSEESPASLRLKAAEFMRLAAKSRNPAVIAELERLAALYLRAAQRRDTGADAPSVIDGSGPVLPAPGAAGRTS